LKISEIKIVPRDIPLKVPFRFASCTLTSLPYAWIRVRTNEGITGYGECPTYWDPSGETQKSAIGAIEHIASQLIGLDPVNLELIFNLFDSVLYGAFAAKCGLDMALYDIQGKVLGVPVHNLLGGRNYTVPVNAVIPLGQKDEIAGVVQKLLEEGFSIFKVKVDRKVENCLSLIQTVAENVDSGCTIFVDANQSWGDAKTAIRAIRKLEKHGVVWVEQPIYAHDIAGLRQVRKSVSASIIVDESLYSHFDAIKIIRSDAADMFNVKLAKSGGMYLGKKLYAVAQAANIPCMLGSMIESSLGMLANYHFACTHRMETCGLSAYSYVADPIDVGLKIENGKLIKTSDIAGLGYPDPEPFEIAFS
jgi:L-alanine-DL-glutamate epimerase-like enolase superfamily enzyme